MLKYTQAASTAMVTAHLECENTAANITSTYCPQYKRSLSTPTILYSSITNCAIQLVLLLQALQKLTAGSGCDAKASQGVQCSIG